METNIRNIFRKYIQNDNYKKKIHVEYKPFTEEMQF